MRSRLLSFLLLATLSSVVALGFGAGLPTADAVTYTPITGEGSSWAANAIDDWRADVVNKGIKVNFAATGSVAGLTGFAQGTDDFAASDIPFGIKTVTPDVPSRSFAYVPDVAGGTALMYNLSVGGKQFTNLKLSGPTIAGIFEGKIREWNDPKIKADNPGVALPLLKITPVVRSDGAGSTAQFTLWMKSQFSSVWTCGEVSFFTQCPSGVYDPTVQQAKSGDNGVAGFVAQAGNVGSIGYVEYSYALQSGYPVAKVLNKAGVYVLPTASNVAVALLKAKVNTNSANPNTYLTQDLSAVYVDTDPRAYPISSYSYFVIPTTTNNGFNTQKGQTLGAFTQYALCQGQQKAPALGYSPLPINLAEAGLAQVKKIPGAVASTINIKSCNNPTFSSSGVNTLATQALYPDKCDKLGAAATCVYGSPISGTKASSTSGQGDNNAAGNHSSGNTGSTTTTSTGTTGTGNTTGTGIPGTGSTATSGPSSSGGSGGASTISLTNPDGKTSCDADTGQCTALAASPIVVSGSPGSTFSRWAIWIAIVVLLVVILVPPSIVLLGRRAAR
ncbi:MAG TPA: phosphate ABC transporter substrate-binding protein PstS [Marmoricola sp.]|jgi:phosphate ABC transporter phosphate-binding protein|nr:phosphate ABC transporter substrate-binding protein PstS [Marmoricola sp.]